MFTVTCRCGHTADLDLFITTVLGQNLPPGHYQCPKCKVAWRVEKTPVVITKWGSVISEPNHIVFTQPELS